MAKGKKYSRYTISAGKNPGAYVVGKMSEDYEPLATYYITEEGKALTCTCPAHKPWCRHMDVLRVFQAEERVGSGYFYIPESKTWIAPIQQEPDDE